MAYVAVLGIDITPETPTAIPTIIIAAFGISCVITISITYPTITPYCNCCSWGCRSWGCRLVIILGSLTKISWISWFGFPSIVNYWKWGIWITYFIWYQSDIATNIDFLEIDLNFANSLLMNESNWLWFWLKFFQNVSLLKMKILYFLEWFPPLIFFLPWIPSFCINFWRTFSMINSVITLPIQC